MKKNHITMICAGLLAVSACSLKAQSNYTVTIPVAPENNNAMAYLFDWDSSQKVDSVIVTDGVAKFSGNVSEPFIGRLVVAGERVRLPWRARKCNPFRRMGCLGYSAK